MLTSSALVLEEKLEQERAVLEKKKSGLNLTQLTDDVTINGITWRDLKHKLVSKDFDFYSFWVSSCYGLTTIYLENFVSRRRGNTQNVGQCTEGKRRYGAP